MANDGKLIIEIRNARPVELLDLTASFLALGREYEDFVDADLVGDSLDTKLLVKEIRSGSIIAELMQSAPAILPMMSDVNTLIGFTKHISSVFDYLRVPDQNPKPQNLSVSTVKNVSSIVEPTAKDSASQTIIQTEVHNHAPVIVTVNYSGANEIQNHANKELARLSAPAVGLHSAVVMYMHQARNDPSSQSGDRAIIESISRKPVKVVFATEMLKAQVIRHRGNVFQHSFIVDVQVETVRGRAALYKVLRILDEIAPDTGQN